MAQYEVDESIQLDEKIAGLVKKSDKSGVPYGILKKVYDRGMAAWRTGHRPGTTPQQWAFARVNSFLTGGGARKSDADLWSKAKGAKKKKDHMRLVKTMQTILMRLTPILHRRRRQPKNQFKNGMKKVLWLTYHL